MSDDTESTYHLPTGILDDPTWAPPHVLGYNTNFSGVYYSRPQPGFSGGFRNTFGGTPRRSIGQLQNNPWFRPLHIPVDRRISDGMSRYGFSQRPRPGYSYEGFNRWEA